MTLYYTHSLRSRALFEKPVVAQVVKTFPACYGTHTLIIVITGPYFAPDESSRTCPILSHVWVDLVDPFEFSYKTLYALSFSPPCVLYSLDNFISLDSMKLVIFSARSTNYEAPPHVVLSSILLVLFPPSYVQIFSSVPYTQTRSACFFPYCVKTSLTPIQTTVKIIVLYILTFTFFDTREEDKRL
jgi:hypothetical protein